MLTIVLSLMLITVMIFGSMLVATIKFVVDFKYSGTLFNGENKHIEML